MALQGGHQVGTGGWGWGGLVFGGVDTRALWALVIMVVVWLIRSGRGLRMFGGLPYRTRRDSHEAPRAETILAERFARGEIDEAEYRKRLAALRAHGAPR